MPDRLELTKNAQFYQPINVVDDALIDQLLNTASDNIENGQALLLNQHRQIKQVDQWQYTYSVRVFPTKRDVYFFSENIQDRIYAFILILEIDGYIALFRKSCSNINKLLSDYFIPVDHDQLTATFDQNVEFQKLAARVMTMSDKALRAKSYEAADLKGLLSTHAAGRSIPYFLKVRRGNTVKTINAGTGRIVENSQRENIDQIASWAKHQIDLIANPPDDNDFLDAFANKVDLHQVLQVSQPKALMFETGAIFERLNSDAVDLKYRTRKKKTIKISSRVKDQLFRALEVVYELDDEKAAVDALGGAKLRINQRNLSFTSKLLSRFRVIEGENEYTLSKYIIRNGWYSVCFSDPKYMYFMGACFEDDSGVSEIDSILRIFLPKTEINQVTSEKGSFRGNSRNFTSDSMFRVVEDMHREDDYIFCDDLGDEWADHITLNKGSSEICFIHSKHGDVTTSATKFQDVVGQGIKNLGNMFFDADDLLRKKDRTFSNNYIPYKKPATNISRVRKGRSDRLDGFLAEFLQSYNLRRKCILSCSFVSKGQIAREFQKIKDGNQNVRGNIIQLFWIISSFAHACREMNVEPVIYCKS
ncbi:MAG: hypothetical protein OIF51_17290 [Cellvibrionaceae bacterium]|nr:hypothetical protein [Cellvibrionaceae bacterium]